MLLKGRWHVTADLVKRTVRLKASTKIIQKHLHKCGVYFKTRGSKPSAVEHCAWKKETIQMLRALLGSIAVPTQYPLSTHSIPIQYPPNTHW